MFACRPGDFDEFLPAEWRTFSEQTAAERSGICIQRVEDLSSNHTTSRSFDSYRYFLFAPPEGCNSSVELA